MSEIQIEISLPLDGSFLRRECPHCVRQFKVEAAREDIQGLSQRLLESFMVEDAASNEDVSDELNSAESYCPYCGQQASREAWWTQEQLAYVRVFAENLMADAINQMTDGLHRSLGHSRSGFVSVKGTSRKMPKKEPWISPEDDSMRVFDLPCCESRIKILDDWRKTVFCLSCGFPHSRK